jgi:hypothetical protein
MSVRALILVLVAFAVGVAIGHYAFPRSQMRAISGGASADGGRDDAARAASRAMTFTQPKAPVP